METPDHVLVVDDDRQILGLLRRYLEEGGLRVSTAGNAAQMRAVLAAGPVDLIVLDLMLPGVDGLALAHALRARSRIPIIILTARSNPYDCVLGLEMGADDYMSKPFEPRELVARIQTVLRRMTARPEGSGTHANSDVIRFDGWELDRNERCLTSPAGLVVALSNAEFRLLSTFLRTPRRVFSRDQLMEQARGRAMDSFERSIDLLVSRLRQKLADDPRDPSMIKTVRGAGYMFNVRSVQGQLAWRN